MKQKLRIFRRNSLKNKCIHIREVSVKVDNNWQSILQLKFKLRRSKAKRIQKRKIEDLNMGPSIKEELLKEERVNMLKADKKKSKLLRSILQLKLKWKILERLSTIERDQCLQLSQINKVPNLGFMTKILRLNSYKRKI